MRKARREVLARAPSTLGGRVTYPRHPHSSRLFGTFPCCVAENPVHPGGLVCGPSPRNWPSLFSTNPSTPDDVLRPRCRPRELRPRTSTPVDVLTTIAANANDWVRELVAQTRPHRPPSCWLVDVLPMAPTPVPDVGDLSGVGAHFDGNGRRSPCVQLLSLESQAPRNQPVVCNARPAGGLTLNLNFTADLGVLHKFPDLGVRDSGQQYGRSRRSSLPS